MRHGVSEEHVEHFISGVMKRRFELGVPEASEDSETTKECIEDQDGDPEHVKVLRNVCRHAKGKVPQDSNVPLAKDRVINAGLSGKETHDFSPDRSRIAIPINVIDAVAARMDERTMNTTTFLSVSYKANSLSCRMTRRG